jgi:LPXTG-site transpeptidase (sortase) family protein
MKILARLFFFFSIVLCAFSAYQIALRENTTRLTFDNYAYNKPFTIHNKAIPRFIAIPSLAITAPIYPAAIDNNHWETTTIGVSYLQSSPLPGEQGNSIFYAHNWRNLFGNLVEAKIGQNVIITYPDGTKKVFVISYTSIVSPNDATILAPSQDKRITLYTCTGLFDSQRFVAVALLKKG